MRSGFEHQATATDLRLDSLESRFLAELHRTMRINLLVTVGVLGALVTVMAGITAGL